MKKVGIIGAGKIGGSLLQRLAESGGFDLGVSDIHPEQLALYRESGVRTTSSNRELAEESDLLIVAVKPWDVTQVMREISPSFEGTDRAVASVAAGVTIERISESLPEGAAILPFRPRRARVSPLPAPSPAWREPRADRAPSIARPGGTSQPGRSGQGNEPPSRLGGCPGAPRVYSPTVTGGGT